AIGNSAERLIEGGPAAIAIAPAGLADRGSVTVRQIVAIGDASGGAQATAESLAGALGATVAPVANEETDLLVIDSRPEAEPGHISITASAERGRGVRFARVRGSRYARARGARCAQTVVPAAATRAR